MGVRNEDRSFHLVFLSFSDYQDGAAVGSEDGEAPTPYKTQYRQDAEHSECPRGSPRRSGDSLLLPPWSPGPKDKHQLPNEKRDLSWGRAPWQPRFSG